MAVGEISFDVPESTALLTAKQVAAWLQISERSLWRMRSAGQLPAPLRLGGAVRWRREELAAWLAAGCPPQPKPA
ncbi:MAG: helix-turn-helix domain-containing protein [Planctomycetales bacterium]|nr:helix-turn-helix domain-containing protein [Planctomycetales bacterium]MBN8624971.1 helix-turn-helix domain-containing protein [Planctomycetota bacterium]